MTLWACSLLTYDLKHLVQDWQLQVQLQVSACLMTADPRYCTQTKHESPTPSASAPESPPTALHPTPERSRQAYCHGVQEGLLQ